MFSVLAQMWMRRQDMSTAGANLDLYLHIAFLPHTMP